MPFMTASRMQGTERAPPEIEVDFEAEKHIRGNVREGIFALAL